MKKVLSLVLAVMLVFGMSATAFAAAFVFSSTAEEVGDTNDYKDLGTYAPGNNGSYELTVTEAFTAAGTGTVAGVPSGALNGKLTGITAEAKDNTTTTEATVKFTVAAGTANGTYEGRIVFGDLTLFASVTVDDGSSSGLYTTVPSGWRISGFSNDVGATWSPATSIAIGEEKDELPITAEMFTWEVKQTNGKYEDATGPELATLAPNAKLRSSHLSNVGVRRVYQKGTANTIASVELKDSKSLVEVKTVKYYVKTGNTDIELKLALTFKSKSSDIVIANYSWTMANSEEFIEEGQNQAYSYGHVFQKAEATVRDVEFEGDEDGIVYATKTVVKGQKYYFNVDSEISNADAQIIAENPEVDSIYTVHQVNMANATIEFRDLDREYFVYDGAGNLLGTTKDKKLALASKYILTTARVDFGGTGVEESEAPTSEPDPSTDVEAPPMGGGEVEAPVNNYNPNTGL